MERFLGNRAHLGGNFPKESASGIAVSGCVWFVVLEVNRACVHLVNKQIELEETASVSSVSLPMGNLTFYKAPKSAISW